MSVACVYLCSDHPFFTRACLNSISMLRRHNSDVPVRVYFVAKGEGDGRSFLEACRSAGVSVEHRPFAHAYFPLHKTYIADGPEDRTLYLDCDTFVYGDVAALFADCRLPAAACPDLWAYGHGWDDGMNGGVAPVNSGVMLWDTPLLRRACGQLEGLCGELAGGGCPAGRWLRGYDPGCYCREEFAFSLFLSRHAVPHAQFDRRHAANARCEEDLRRRRESVVFHSYNFNWRRVARWDGQGVRRFRLIPHSITG